MAEEAKDSPSRKDACEFPEGSLDLLKKLTDGKPGTRETDGWNTWKEIVQIMNEHFEPVNKIYYPKFTYKMLQAKAVAEGWYAPAPPLHHFGNYRTSHRVSNMLDMVGLTTGKRIELIMLVIGSPFNDATDVPTGNPPTACVIWVPSESCVS